MTRIGIAAVIAGWACLPAVWSTGARAAECTPVLEGGSTSYVGQGTLPAGRAGSCFTFTAKPGVQVVATIARAKSGHVATMSVFVGKDGVPGDRLVSSMDPRFSTEDAEANLGGGGSVDGTRRFRIVVSDHPGTGGPAPFGLRVSLDDPADACAAILGAGQVTYTTRFPVPDALHDRCWTFSAAAGSHVSIEAAPHDAVLLDVGARNTGGGGYSLAGLPAPRFDNADTADTMVYADTSHAAKQFRVTLFADPDRAAAGGDVSLSVKLGP